MRCKVNGDKPAKDTLNRGRNSSDSYKIESGILAKVWGKFHLVKCIREVTALQSPPNFLVRKNTMSKLDRDTVQDWIDLAQLDSYVCPDCEGIHLHEWEAKDAVLEARCFVEKERVSLLIEVAIRPSAVLPLQGAVHFMNYDYSYIKVMIAMVDHDVPRLLLTHAIPAAHLKEVHFQSWLKLVLEEIDAVYKHLSDMEVLLIDDDFLDDFDDQLH